MLYKSEDYFMQSYGFFVIIANFMPKWAWRLFGKMKYNA